MKVRIRFLPALLDSTKASVRSIDKNAADANHARIKRRGFHVFEIDEKASDPGRKVRGKKTPGSAPALCRNVRARIRPP